MDSTINLVQSIIGFSLGFSLLGCVELTSVALIIYYIYAKTRAPAIIGNLFPNLNIKYRAPLQKFNSIRHELMVTFRKSKSVETTTKAGLAHGYGTKNLLKITPHAGKKPFNSSFFDWGVYFPHVAQSIRTKKYNYPQISGIVRKDPLVQRAIKQAAEEILREQKLSKHDSASDITNSLLTDETARNFRETQDYQDILKKQEKRAMSILMDMRSTLNNFLLALTSWILYKLLPCFLSGVVTHTQQIEMLKAASQRAPGIPLIFLPLHRSHLDYVMVTFILTNNDIRSPLVAAGNNLQIPVFGGLLRGLGAFFIKRKIDPVVGKKDTLYRAMLQLYIQHALKSGHNVEFFIEGGRTRTGKPCMPKGGILSVIVNAFMDRSIPDALLVPVSVNYERLVDGNFVREQKGEKKVPESFGKAMSGIWKALNSKYGMMRIDFNEPYSIRELVQSYNKIAKEDGTLKVYQPGQRPLQHNQSTSSLYGTDVICEEHRTLIESISRQVVYDCAAATSVMSTNALAFLLLTQFRHGGVDFEIAKALDELRKVLKGRRDLGFCGDSLHIINYASDLLGRNLVIRTLNDDLVTIIKPNPSIESMIELAYYSNMLTPHFALESILLTSLYSMLPNDAIKKALQDSTETIGVPRKRLIDNALESCDVFRYEYILNKPTQVLENLLESTLDELVVKGLVKVAQTSLEPESTQESRKISQRIASYLDEGDEYYGDENSENMNEDKPEIFFATETFKEQKAICEVLAPFSQTYYIVARSLQILYKNSMLESEFIKFVIKDITARVKSNSCPYAESISTDSVRNCLKLLEKWSVIQICNQHGLRLISLGSTYESSTEEIKTVVERIHVTVPKFRELCS